MTPIKSKSYPIPFNLLHTYDLRPRLPINSTPSIVFSPIVPTLRLSVRRRPIMLEQLKSSYLTHGIKLSNHSCVEYSCYCLGLGSGWSLLSSICMGFQLTLCGSMKLLHNRTSHRDRYLWSTPCFQRYVSAVWTDTPNAISKISTVSQYIIIGWNYCSLLIQIVYFLFKL